MVKVTIDADDSPSHPCGKDRGGKGSNPNGSSGNDDDKNDDDDDSPSNPSGKGKVTRVVMKIVVASLANPMSNRIVSSLSGTMILNRIC